MRKKAPRISLKLSDLDALIDLASYAVGYNPSAHYVKRNEDAFVRVNHRRIQMHDRILQRRLDESE